MLVAIYIKIQHLLTPQSSIYLHHNLSSNHFKIQHLFTSKSSIYLHHNLAYNHFKIQHLFTSKSNIYLLQNLASIYIKIQHEITSKSIIQQLLLQNLASIYSSKNIFYSTVTPNMMKMMKLMCPSFNFIEQAELLLLHQQYVIFRPKSYFSRFFHRGISGDGDEYYKLFPLKVGKKIRGKLREGKVSGCGSVGRAVASDYRGPRFSSSHGQNFTLNIYCPLYRIDNNIEKVAENCPFLKIWRIKAHWLVNTGHMTCNIQSE